MPSLSEILENKKPVENSPVTPPQPGSIASPGESQGEPGNLSTILEGKPKQQERLGGIDTGERLEQGGEPSITSRFMNLFKDPEKEAASAVQAIVDADMQNAGRKPEEGLITPSQAMRLRKHIDKGVKLDPARAKLRAKGMDLLKQNLSKGYAQVNLGLWGAQALAGDNSEETWDAIRRTQAEMPRPEEIAYSENFAQEFGASAAEMFPFLAESTRRGAWRGLLLAGGTGLLGAATGTAEFTYPLIPAMYAVGQTSKSLEFVGKVEGGLAYIDLLDYEDPDTGEKVNPEVARAAAYGVGAINGLIEFAQLKTLLNTFPGGKKLLQGLINETVTDVVKSRALHNIVARTTTQYGTTIAKETAQEISQESVNVVAEVFSRKLTNHLDGTDLSGPEKEEIISRLMEVAKTSAQAFTVMALPGSALTGGTQYYEGRQLTREQQARQERAQKIFKATAFERLKEVQEQTTLEERQINVTPEEVQQFIENPEESTIDEAVLDEIIAEGQELDIDALINEQRPDLVGATEKGSIEEGDAPTHIDLSGEWLAVEGAPGEQKALVPINETDKTGDKSTQYTIRKDREGGYRLGRRIEYDDGEVFEDWYSVNVKDEFDETWLSKNSSRGPAFVPVTFKSEEEIAAFIAEAHGLAEEDAPAQIGSVATSEEDAPGGFEAWSKGHDVVEGYDIIMADPNKGHVFKVYHGTTNEFSIFDPTVKGNKEGQFGAVNYFTSDQGDADINYAGEGPDLTLRIDMLAERLEGMDAEDIADELGIDIDEAEAALQSDEALRQIATERLSGDTPQTMELFIRLDNPVFIGGPKETWIDNDVIEQYREDATDEVLEENGADKSQTEEFEDEIRERMEDYAINDEPPIFEAIQNAIQGFDTDVDAVKLYGELEIYDYEISATDLENRLRDSDSLTYADDYESGENVGSHIIGQVFKNLGYDGIVLQNADQRFANMDMGAQTAHVHVFEETPSNIKSAADNSGEFDPNNPDIYAQVGKTNQSLPEFTPDSINHVNLREATQSGLISEDEAAVIDGVMQIFPESWQEYFEPRFSDQQFAPTGAQLKAHGIPASQAGDKIIEGVLLTEKAGDLKEQARHLAVMFNGSNIDTFLHEFGEFAHKRLLGPIQSADMKIVSREYKKAQAKFKKKKGNARKAFMAKNEWFADGFRDWWLRQLNGESDIVSKDLQGVFRKVLAAIKEIWRRLKSLGKKHPLDDLFSDIITNGRDLQEKYYYSSKEMVLRYIVGQDATTQDLKKQGFAANGKTLMSWDPGTICPKKRNLLEYVAKYLTDGELGDIRDIDAQNEIWDELLNPDFWIRIYDQAVKDGVDVPCSYCYVEQTRKVAVHEFNKGKSISDVIAVKAKPVYETTPYRDAILKWSQEKIDDLNKSGGLRLFAFSDYVRDWHKDNVALLLKHAKQRGLSIKAITKNPEFVEDFAGRGITINVSIDDGVLGQNGGMPWDTAVRLKKKYPNVKVRTVALNLKEYQYYATLDYKGMLNFIDVITPYHHSDYTKPLPAGASDFAFMVKDGQLVGRNQDSKDLVAWIEANPRFQGEERTCCLVGGKCFHKKHQKQCASNCGGHAGNLSVPAQVGTRKEASIFKAIKDLGGINFEGHKFKDLPKGMSLLSKKDGMKLDKMEAKLREEGWLKDDESLLDAMSEGLANRREDKRREINLDKVEELGGREALKRALMVAVQDARKAYAEGNTEGVKEGKAKIRAIMAKSQAAQKLRNEASKLRNQIWRELKATKLKKKDGKPQGRFGAERQEVLNSLKGIMKLRRDDAAERLEGTLIAYQEGGEIPPHEISLQLKLLAMKSTSLFEIDAETLESWGRLLNEIKQYKSEGILERDLKAANRSNLMAFYRQELIDIMGGIPEGIETAGEEAVTDKAIKTRIRNAIFAGGANNIVTGWKDLLDILSYKDQGSAPGQSLISQFGDVLDVKNAEKEGNLQAMEELRQIIFEVFQIQSDRQMVKMFQQDSVEQSLGTFENMKGEVVELKMSRAQARKRAMELLDPTLHDTIFAVEGMAWSQAMVDALREFLTPQDEAFIARQMDWYREYYNRTNQIYSEIYGVNLPKNDNYSPISREGVNKDDESGLGEFLKEMPFRASATTAGGLKSRTANLYPLKLRNDMEVLMSHVAEMEHFKAWAFKVRDLNAVFSNPNVRQAIRINFGENIDRTIQNFIQDFARGGAEMATSIRGLDKIRSRYTQAVLAVKPTLFLKQLTSSVAFADSIPVAFWSKEFIKTLFNLREATKVLMTSTMMKHRWEKGEIERDIKTAMNSDSYAKFRTSPSFTNALMFQIKLGDIGAIIGGGYPVYKYYRSQGMTHEEAIRQFESIAESTQQSSDLSEQSTWQRGGSFAKLFTMFRSSPNQYLRKEIGAIRNLAAGRISRKQFFKTMAIYHFILPMFFQWVSDRFTWDEEEQKRAMILGSLNGFFILGDGLDFLIRKALDMHAFDMGIPIYQIFEDLAKAIDLVDIDELDAESFLRAVRGLAGAVGSIIGKPLKQAVDISTGFSDTLAGEYEKGIAEMMGWSPHTAEKTAIDDDE